MGGASRAVRGKWRQLYLNNNKNTNSGALICSNVPVINNTLVNSWFAKSVYLSVLSTHTKYSSCMKYVNQLDYGEISQYICISKQSFMPETYTIIIDKLYLSDVVKNKIIYVNALLNYKL